MIKVLREGDKMTMVGLVEQKNQERVVKRVKTMSV